MSGERTIHLEQQPRKWPLSIIVILLIIMVTYLTIETMRLKQRVATIASQQLDAEDLKYLTNDLPGMISHQVHQSLQTIRREDDESSPVAAPEAEEEEGSTVMAAAPQPEPPLVIEEVVVKGGGKAATRRRSSRSKKDEVEEVVMTN